MTFIGKSAFRKLKDDARIIVIINRGTFSIAGFKSYADSGAGGRTGRTGGAGRAAGAAGRSACSFFYPNSGGGNIVLVIGGVFIAVGSFERISAAFGIGGTGNFPADAIITFIFIVKVFCRGKSYGCVDGIKI